MRVFFNTGSSFRSKAVEFPPAFRAGFEQSLAWRSFPAMPHPASPPDPYKPIRPPVRATAREFLLLLPRARDFLRMRHEPAGGGAGARSAVMVIPTLFCGDWQTVRLRAAISRAGYACFGWDLGIDWGPTPRLMQGAEARLLALAQTHGPVRLVGLSMGGLFCRWLAFRHPELVRQVITVCSPFRAPIDSFWLPLRPVLKIWPVPGLAGLAEDLQRPLPVPCASLFSKHDGIVARASCYDPARPEECFEIEASHVMIANDPSVAAIVRERLDAVPGPGCHPPGGML
jgi:pimeloyl-ACP methyl ester carboxylesterase